MFGLAVEGIHFLSLNYSKSIKKLGNQIEVVSSWIHFCIQIIVASAMILTLTVSKTELKKQVQATRGMFRIIPDKVFIENRFMRQLVLSDKKAIQGSLTKNKKKIFKNRSQQKSKKK